MKRTVPFVLLVIAGLAPGTAHAAAGPANEQTCGFSTVTNPFTENRQSGTVDSGPVLLADGTDPRAGRIRCTIQVNGYRHADPDAASVTSLTTAGVAWLPPTTVEYDVGDADSVILCTEVEIVGAGTFYWDAHYDVWSTDPYSSCVGALADPPEPLLDRLLDDVWAVVDPVVCPPLAAAAPGAGPVTVRPDGDVAVADSTVWDCPPYAWS